MMGSGVLRFGTPVRLSFPWCDVCQSYARSKHSLPFLLPRAAFPCTWTVRLIVCLGLGTAASKTPSANIHCLPDHPSYSDLRES